MGAAMAHDFNGRVIAVTGGGGDIGGAVCRNLDRNGAVVVVLDVDVAGGESWRRRLTNPQARFQPLDVSDSAAVRDVFQSIAADYGRIDGLVNGAGIARLLDCWDTDDDAWRRTIDINLSGVHYCSREVAKLMMPNRRGAIVNVSSTNGLVGEERLLAYNASKFGVMGVTKTMAAELGDYGIRVNAVNPGFIETRLTAEPAGRPRVRSRLPCEDPAAPLRQAGRSRRLRRFLLSDEASFVTGVGLVVDGGQICH